MFETIKDVSKSGWNIETILWARIKIFVGMSFTALQQSGVDVASFVEDHRWQNAIRIFMAFLVVDGTLSEWARRRNADDIYTPKEPLPEDK